MDSNALTIEPLEGFGKLKFGQTIEQTVRDLGEAEQVEQIDEEEFDSVVMHYWDKGVSIFFEGISKSVISCFETDNTAATLFGKAVFELDKKAIISLMKKNGYKEYELELEEGENRLTFEEGLIDFFFENNELIAVSWGVLVNKQGEIEHF